MHKDFIIVGQGIAGTLLSYELLHAGKTVMVIDAPDTNKASLVASAVINPLIAKNWSIAKDAAVLIPAAIDTYSKLGRTLGSNFISIKSLLVFHQNEKEETTFETQIIADNPYLNGLNLEEIENLKQLFLLENKIGEVGPVYTVNANLLLEKWQLYLQKNNSMIEDKFDATQLLLSENKVHYKDVSADKIIFCEGAVGRNNPFFPHQHFTTNRGDVLLLSIPDLNTENLYQKGIRLVPRADGLFWCGSNYTWKYHTLSPDENWRTETEKQLNSWLKIPYKIEAHHVAERPTTAGQIPLLLQSETRKNVYFFNGLGTRGFSAGPSLAKEMSAIVQK